jgi:CDP-glucose 4,6-dehydratase
MAQKMAGKNELSHYNIGPSDADCQNVGWIADRMVAAWNRQSPAKAQWRHEPDNSIYEAGLLKLNNTKARGELGWQPRWTTEQAIEHTAIWYAAHQSGGDMAAITRTQIEHFING